MKKKKIKKIVKRLRALLRASHKLKQSNEDLVYNQSIAIDALVFEIGEILDS